MQLAAPILGKASLTLFPGTTCHSSPMEDAESTLALPLEGSRLTLRQARGPLRGVGGGEAGSSACAVRFCPSLPGAPVGGEIKTASECIAVYGSQLRLPDAHISCLLKILTHISKQRGVRAATQRGREQRNTSSEVHDV
jgi:hypothetical protein